MIRVLLFSYKVPFPKKDGGAVSIANHLQLLESIPEINLHVFCLNQETDLQDTDTLNRHLSDRTSSQIVPVNNKIRLMPLLSSLMRKKSYLSNRFESSSVKNSLISVLSNNNYDLIILEHLYLCHYLKTIKFAAPTIKIILRQQNIEHQLWNEIAQHEQNIFKRFYLKYESKKLKKFEHASINIVDGVICLTDENKGYVIKNTSQKIVESIPISFSCDKLPNISKINSSKIYHVGSMDWKPNLQGLEWYFNTIHDRLISNYENIEVHIGGKNMPDKISSLSIKNVVNHGEINDMKSFEKGFDIMFVPLITGSGVRVKILEGICKGKTIITTNKGVEGINYNNFANIYIANNAEEFIDKLKKIKQIRKIDFEKIKTNFNKEYGFETNKKKTLKLISHVIKQ